MGFLRRLLGSGSRPVDEDASAAPATAAPAPATREPDDELARAKALLLEEARRVDNDLIQRQLRYADRSWTPPAQGGSRRADDEDAKRESAT